MSQKNTRRHLVDILFVLALFAVFTICGLLLIILGTHLYQKNMDDMNDNYANRTGYAFFTEKIRQSGNNCNIYIDHSSPIELLCIEQEFHDTMYITYLYEDEGYLKELFTRAENSFSPSEGIKILCLSNLSFEEIRPDLLSIHFMNDKNKPIQIYIDTTL